MTLNSKCIDRFLFGEENGIMRMKFIERIPERTEKCRLILSVERMLFNNKANAAIWDSFTFENGHCNIYYENALIEKLLISDYQSSILEENVQLLNLRIKRKDLQRENSKWSPESQDFLDRHAASHGFSTKTYYGGEAMVFYSKIEEQRLAIRVQCFDPWLFTSKMSNFRYCINSAKYFETAVKDNGHLPRHESIIEHHFNVELFHSDDLGHMDTIGWITVMDAGDCTLRDKLRDGNLPLKARKEIYGQIVSGYEYLGSVGLTYNDLKPENIIIFPNNNGALTVRIIDYGLATDVSNKEGFRKMGYVRRGSRYQYAGALHAGTPGFCDGKAIHGFDNCLGPLTTLSTLIFSDYKSAFYLLYASIEDEYTESQINEMAKNANALTENTDCLVKKIRDFSAYPRNDVTDKLTYILDVRNLHGVNFSDIMIDGLNLDQAMDHRFTQSIDTRVLLNSISVKQDPKLKNLPKNIMQQENTFLCTFFAVSTLMKEALVKCYENFKQNDESMRPVNATFVEEMGMDRDAKSLHP